MNPFFFGSSQQQLFGAYDPPIGGGRRGVVLCYPPRAREYVLAHPTMRLLARRLAENGWHALRFDYYGTGDSAGDLADATQEQWLTDIDTAVEELKDIGQVTQVALFGMRYGAALASQIAGRRRDVEKLILWDPIYDGQAYLMDLNQSLRGVVGQGDDHRRDTLAQRLRHDIEALTPDGFGPSLPATLVVNTDTREAACEPLVSHLTGSGVDCSHAHVPDVRVWFEEWGPGGARMAVGAVNRVLAWMS